jgi:hypothetical protein
MAYYLVVWFELNKMVTSQSSFGHEIKAQERDSDKLKTTF